MSALSSILCFVVIFQIFPQLLCDDTTIMPTDASSKPTVASSTVDVKPSPTDIPLASSSAVAAASPSLPPSSTMLPSDTTMKPTRAPTGAAAAASSSTQPPLIHKSPEPLPTNKTVKSSMAAKNTTKTEKNSANSIYNRGVLASFIVLLVGAIF